jgi:hypothetical protein
MWGARGGIKRRCDLQTGEGECRVLGKSEGRWDGVLGDVACGVAGYEGEEGGVEYLELVAGWVCAEDGGGGVSLGRVGLYGERVECKRFGRHCFGSVFQKTFVVSDTGSLGQSVA